MPLALDRGTVRSWEVRKIGVIGPGIVGMPMAALLAHARIREGTDAPAVVTVVQRRSPTSGWKVDAINAGRSPIGGVEPGLEKIVAEAVAAGLLRATDDYGALRDADVVLICVQTDKLGFGPDYGPLFEALDGLAKALQSRPVGNVPIIVFESTLAPSSMATVIREHFLRYGLEEGRDILLGNSPNRVMPGRLVERVDSSDKILAGLHPATPGLIARLYKRVVTRGQLHLTNSMTAEIVKTLENAYRDVRIAFAAELVRYCDAHDLDFHHIRGIINERSSQTDAASFDPAAIPSGGLLIPTVGVGGHCLPKDGILLWWRRLEYGNGHPRSLILEARHINDQSPAATIALAERAFGSLAGRRVALLGTAYRSDSEDTRNSPTLALAALLAQRGASVMLHDPYVYPTDQNLVRSGFQDRFSRELPDAVRDAEIVIVCTGHQIYGRDLPGIVRHARGLSGVVDACNLFTRADVERQGLPFAGIGRGRQAPPAELVEAAWSAFRAIEVGVANELESLIDFLNSRYAATEFNRVSLDEVRRLAGTCVTGCRIAETGPVPTLQAYDGFKSSLADCAVSPQAASKETATSRA